MDDEEKVNSNQDDTIKKIVDEPRRAGVTDALVEGSKAQCYRSETGTSDNSFELDFADGDCLPGEEKFIQQSVVEQTLADGKQRHFPDGSHVSENGFGQVVGIGYADGRSLNFEYSSSSIDAAVIRITREDGTASERNEDGSWILHDVRSGESYEIDSVTHTVSLEGALTQQKSDGSILVQYRNGAAIQEDSDHNVVNYRSSAGRIFRFSQDGGAITVAKDGDTYSKIARQLLEFRRRDDQSYIVGADEVAAETARIQQANQGASAICAGDKILIPPAGELVGDSDQGIVALTDVKSTDPVLADSTDDGKHTDSSSPSLRAAAPFAKSPLIRLSLAAGGGRLFGSHFPKPLVGANCESVESAAQEHLRIRENPPAEPGTVSGATAEPPLPDSVEEKCDRAPQTGSERASSSVNSELIEAASAPGNAPDEPVEVVRGKLRNADSAVQTKESDFLREREVGFLDPFLRTDVCAYQWVQLWKGESTALVLDKICRSVLRREKSGEPTSVELHNQKIELRRINPRVFPAEALPEIISTNVQVKIPIASKTSWFRADMES